MTHVFWCNIKGKNIFYIICNMGFKNKTYGLKCLSVANWVVIEFQLYGRLVSDQSLEC